ncbi:hypothetical protein NIBR502772_01045 [Pseudarthrobacter sp. NIBRBAC000502772]|uniref:PxKF domain-containing protein n=1 Tax=Pseudarthrobacter sp. NIBRBAC000502772 TaxID=2590775 RepID=UPI0011310548|nr:PxKF domain-containing protein [Pseudarthrobacter sp. NIBRBAC000502772]QDG64975.1 hypothetical protein NIBR502772_01045 [Pseudarthrobacter sp. NIBRBAC000502772]
MNHSALRQDTGPGKRLLRRAAFKAAAAMAAGSLLLASAGMVYADAISNRLDTTVDLVAEVMPLNLGGPAGTTNLYVVKIKDDGNNGCTIQGGEQVSLSLSSSNAAVATVTPATASFVNCGAETLVTVTPLGVGTTLIYATPTGNTTSDVYDVAPVNFRVNVTAAAPSNTAPVLTITGVAAGATYAKGSVPPAVCNVTDAEDGLKTFPATLGAITGPDAATGVGSQEASCFHSDLGGLEAASSLSYSIADATAPGVSYTLSPATPDGFNGWYRSAVHLAWTVTENDSPTTLSSVGCVDAVITLDQLPGDYSCSATSGGGSAGPVTVSIKKDGTAPGVALTDASGTAGNADWYTSDVTATFTATDATSGPASASDWVTSSGEGSAVVVLSPAFTDNAGNTTAAGAVSPTFKIDKTAPAVSYTGANPAAPNTNGWYKTDVVATFGGSDATSGLVSAATQPVTSSGEGVAVLVQSPAFEDVAGNMTPAGALTESFQIDKTPPTANFSSLVPTGYFGSTAAAPTCVASDSLSGLDGTCVVSGYGTSVGPHTLTATATDQAGNSTTITQNYEVLAWTLKGFYQPVDMGGVLNTVKGGSTVPAKFEVFAGDTEITDPGLMSFSMARITCSLTVLQDAIETTATGSTSLRYDTTGGQFIYNWKTPTGAGTCYQLAMTAADGSTIKANFKLK